jgi:hypothetical protein
MHLVRRGIDLIEQTLQIDRAAGAGSGNDEFHGFRSAAGWPGDS